MTALRCRSATDPRAAKINDTSIYGRQTAQHEGYFDTFMDEAAKDCDQLPIMLNVKTGLSETWYRLPFVRRENVYEWYTKWITKLRTVPLLSLHTFNKMWKKRRPCVVCSRKVKGFFYYAICSTYKALVLGECLHEEDKKNAWKSFFDNHILLQAAQRAKYLLDVILPCSSCSVDP